MKCPKCKNQLPREFFESSYNFSADLRCCNCNFKITRKIINANIEPGDCIQVREGIISAEDFQLHESCQDCHADCIFASSVTGDFDLVQDEEGNWVYPEDL